MNNTHRTVCLLASTATSVLCFETSFAQNDEIVVSATRTDKARSTLALSLDKIGGDTIDAANVLHPAEILNTVAGVNIHRGSGQEHLTAIRSPVLTGGAGAGSFLYLEDGVPMRAAGFANVNGLFETGSEFAGAIEVIKGPGSVLYGSNAVHGLINVISAEPGETRAKIMIGSRGSIALTATGSVNTTSGSVYITHDNGFRDASGYDQQKLQVRSDAHLGDWQSKTLITAQNLNQETAGFIKGIDAYKDDAIRFTNPNPEAYRDAQSIRGQIRLDKQVSNEANLALTPYARSTRLNFRRHFVPGKAIEKNGHDSIGILSTLYGPDYILGLDAEYTDGFLDEFQPGPREFSYVSGAHYNYAVKSTVLAGYGQKDIALGTHTKFTAGLRGEYTHYAYDNQIDSGTFGRFKRIDDQSDDFFVVLPKLSLIHEFDNSQLYARLARGARAPQTSDLYSLQKDQNTGEIKVETLDSAELGWRGRIGPAKLEAAAFAMRKDHFFFRNTDGYNVANGKTEHIGVELSADIALSERIDTNVNLTLADHTYAFTDIVTSASNSITDGDEVDTAPKVIANAALSYQVTDKIEARLGWRHMGKYFTDPGNTKSYPGHDVFTLSGQWDFPNQVRLFGRIDNLLDAKYADRADFGFGSERYFPGRPRTFFAGVEKHF